MLMATHDSLVSDYVDMIYHLDDGQVAQIETPTLSDEAGK